MFKLSVITFVALVSVSSTALCANSQSEKDAQWDRLIDEAVRHGGVETVLDKSASYVFGAPDGMSITFTRTLDNKVRAVCAGYMSKNFFVCADWNTGKLRYSSRQDEASPWIASETPPDIQETSPDEPLWLSLVSALLDTDVDYPTFRGRGHHALAPFSVGRFGHSFDHIVTRTGPRGR